LNHVKHPYDIWPWLIGTLAVCLNFLLANRYGLSIIGDKPFYLLNDDYMIIQRYAYNFVHSGQLVYNLGQRVEGFSEPFILFMLAIPLELLKIDSAMIGLVVWIVHAVVSGIIALLIYLTAKRSGHRNAGILMAAIYISLPNHSFFAFAGLSVYLEALGILLAFYFLRKQGKAFWTIMAVLPLLHATMLPIWGMLLLIRWSIFKKRAIIGSVAAIIPLVSYFAFRIIYYGLLFPNTYYMKSSGVWNFSGGLMYVTNFLGWMIPLAILAVIVFRQSDSISNETEKKILLRDLAIAFLPYLAFTLKVGGDNFGWYRFYFILMPTFMMYLGHLQANGKAKMVIIGLVFCQFCLNLYGHAEQWEPGQVLRKTETRRVAIGLALKNNTKPDALVAAFGIGQIGYYSQRPILDMLGKTDTYIAKLPPKPTRRVSHQKDSPENAMKHKPDYVCVGFTAAQMADTAALMKESQGEWGYGANLALNPEFRANYRQLIGPEGPVGLYCRNDHNCDNWVLPLEIYLR
jgi:hypothetical protein